MIVITESPTQRFSRTIRRLRDAQEAIDRGDYTVAALLVRVAIDTAQREMDGRSVNQGLFVFARSMEAGVTRGTIRRIRRLHKRANQVVHGSYDAHGKDARRMLTLFRAIAARWLQRAELAAEANQVTGDARGDRLELTPEELVTV